MLLFRNNQPREKIFGDPDFYVRINWYDETAACDLLEILNLNKSSNTIDKNCNLDVFDKLSAPQIQQKLFYNRRLQTFIRSVEFVNLISNLKTESDQPLRKPNNDPISIYIKWNHPSQIMKKLPKSFTKLLSENSSSKELLGKSKTLCKKYLNNSGFNKKI